MELDIIWSSQKKPFVTSPMATISSLRTDDNDNTYPIEFLKFQDGIQPVLLGMTKDLNSRTSSARIRQSVHFPDDDKMVVIVEFEDDVESKRNRLCYWEIFARDRARFKDRIQQTQQVIAPILERSHRERIFLRLENHSCELSKSSSFS